MKVSGGDSAHLVVLLELSAEPEYCAAFLAACHGNESSGSNVLLSVQACAQQYGGGSYSMSIRSGDRDTTFLIDDNGKLMDGARSRQFGAIVEGMRNIRKTALTAQPMKVLRCW